MREIKFRAWHLKDKFMYGVHAIEFPVGGVKWYGPGVGMGIAEANPKYDWEVDSVLMQYTGLKDKNGKEIYEGDVVKLALPFWKSREFDYIGRVEHCDGAFLCVDVVDLKHRHPYRSCYLRFSRIEMEELFECLETEYMSNHGEVCKKRSENLVYCEVIGNIHQTPELLK